MAQFLLGITLSRFSIIWVKFNVKPKEDAAEIDDSFFAFEESRNSIVETMSLPEDVEVLVLGTLGVRVATDLSFIMQDYYKTKPNTSTKIMGQYADAFDIGPFYKNRGYAQRSDASLSLIYHNVLGNQPLKPQETRVSDTWKNKDLTPLQIKYAALDAWVALKIFEP
ncbi:hypothetical protein [Parasitella parasitica]|uniref:3'-5' exonuclease domain-containing protein n=1 Tax=Parasitella parasitica TaxID=35722 RepID=A0A0B7NHF2_9FUNG|nr:hypothetical protein [Parasitella parasitica]